MKNTALILLGGLAFAGASVAGEPVPQTDIGTSSSLKVGIDAKTGKRRQLTEEESAALDAQIAAKNRTMAKGARTMAKGGLTPPATFEESAANRVSRGGLTGYIAPLESFNSITVTRDANGKITLMEDGVPLQQTREMASE